ncbi:MAG: hypothetical protein A2X49_12840 [Lentisphaerae bacterium GWF2_52_8]|nr:MAG: hypothetical protein A2X49_12840 [Lentisphaerae bacterium GWF2_52_8]
MTKNLPEILRGEWIWKKTLLSRVDSYLFARKEFSLDTNTTDAELWISTHSNCHLFVNGRHIGFGPPPASRELFYAEQYNVSYLLQPGTNVIGILAHHLAIPSCTQYPKVPGIWCQLNINGNPVLWTDNRWRVLAGACYDSNQARRGPGLNFMEDLDLETYPWGWQESHFNDRGWERPDDLSLLGSHEGKMTASPLCCICETLPGGNPVARGIFAKACASSHVSFSGISTGQTGVYAAECHLRYEKPESLPLEIASDDSFRFYCNDVLVLEHGIPDAPPYGAAMPEIAGQLYLQTPSAKTPIVHSAIIQLRSGWNRLLMVQQSGENSMGFAIAFPTVKEENIKLMRESYAASSSGWKIAGPLRLPIPVSSGSLRLENQPGAASYTPVAENLNDASFHLRNCHFYKVASSSTEEQDGDSLAAGEFLLFDLGEMKYGFPSLLLQGHAKDIIDVTCAITLDGVRPPAIDHSGRHSDTIALGTGEMKWLKFEPCAARYIMVSARKAFGKLLVRSMDFQEFFEEKKDFCSFSCSSKEFNNIWNLGRSSLRCSNVHVFMNSPSGSRSQDIVSAMLESDASFFTFGDTNSSKKALREFAAAQLENGLLPSSTPSGFWFARADHSLLWPVWIARYYQYSGDTEFLEELRPTLDRLLDFFNTMSKNGDGLLRDTSKHGLPAFIEDEKLSKSGVLTALNSLYCRALLSSADLYETLARDETAASLRAKAAAIIQKLRSLTWLPERGLFADSHNGSSPSESCSALTNILALYSGVAEPEAFDSIFFQFFSKEEPFEKSPSSLRGALPQFFLLETLFAFNRAILALRYMRQSWEFLLSNDDISPQSPSGACMLRFPSNSAYACANGYIVRELAGLRPAEPGFSRIYFHPCLELASEAKVSLRTRYGRINIEWNLAQDGSIEVKADANYPLDIAPMLPEKILNKLSFALGPSVGILEPNSSP